MRFLLASATPAPSPSPDTASPSLPCWRDGRPGSLCDWVYDRSGTAWLAEGSDWFIAKPIRVLLIVLLALIARAVLNRVIRRLAQRAAEGTLPGVLARGAAQSLFEDSPLLSERRKQRADTMASVLKSVVTGVITAVAFVMVLAEFGFPIGPLLTSAGIAGVALGFGAQTLVKDFLSGIFLILEDQFGVGDAVDLGEASGTVEAVGLRVTRVRDVNGTVWYVRNGEILRVGNKSQGWARAVLDVPIAYGENVARVRELLIGVARELSTDERFAEMILEEPEVWGVEALNADSVIVRVVIKTAPLKQWDVARELRERIKAVFDREGVEVPFAQRMIWMRSDGPGAERTAKP